MPKELIISQYQESAEFPRPLCVGERRMENDLGVKHVLSLCRRSIHKNGITKMILQRVFL
jgi:hypothetical protein